MNRRHLITGLVSLLAAPAVVRASSLMPIQGERFIVWEYRLPILPPIIALKGKMTVEEYLKPYLSPAGNIYTGVWTFFGTGKSIYSDEQISFRKVDEKIISTMRGIVSHAEIAHPAYADHQQGVA